MLCKMPLTNRDKLLGDPCSVAWDLKMTGLRTWKMAGKFSSKVKRDFRTVD